MSNKNAKNTKKRNVSKVSAAAKEEIDRAIADARMALRPSVHAQRIRAILW